MSAERVRRTVLVLAAVVFTAIAAGSLVAPHPMAAQLGYTLDNVDALSEFRAVYVGVWLATAVLLAVGARRIEDVLLGDLAALLILGQTFGRLLGVAIDGLPSARMLPPFVVEAIGGLAILLARPRLNSPRPANRSPA